MAVSVINPIDGRVVDANGNPYVGAKRYVYNAGTTTLRACFTDDDLTIAADNPQISIADGTFPRVFTAPGTYKIRQETSAGVLIGAEVDDIDTGLSAGTVALGIDKGGTGATTAAAARSNLDVPSNSELAAVSATIATFTAALASIAAFPQGRLTLTSGTPVITTGVTAASTVYYTPYTGQLCPVWDGAQFNLKIFAELSLTLNVNHVLNSIYDCYIINDATDGVKLVTAPAWSNIAAGTGSRSGTCDQTRLAGILVNANQLTMRNGGTTYTVAANRGAYVGSLYIDGTAGQVTCHTAYGQSRKWGVWNAYNRVPVALKAGDATASWTYATATLRAANNSSANSITLFSGLAEETYDIRAAQVSNSISNGGAGIGLQTGIGYNSTSAASSFAGRVMVSATSASFGLTSTSAAEYLALPALGINVVTLLEKANGSTQTMSGGEANCIMSARWRA